MKLLKNKIVVGFLSLTFMACDKTIDNTEDVCTADCTVLKGRVVSRNNTPIEGVSLSFFHTTSSPGAMAHTIRKIRNTVTDKNGNFQMNFHLEDSEVGYPGTGYFKLAVDKATVDAKRFIVSNDMELDIAYYMIPKRDTVIETGVYFPEKTGVKVNLKGFKATDKDDRFEVMSAWPYGFKGSTPTAFLITEYGVGRTGYPVLAAKTDNFSTNILAAQGDTNVISVSRSKNGINTSEQVKVFVPDNNNIELTFNW